MMSQIATNFFIIFLLISFNSYSQITSPATYVSKADESVTLKTILLAPSTDNANKIYSNIADKTLKTLIGMDTQWSLIQSKEEFNFQQITNQPKKVSELLAMNNGADALMGMHITKGAMGLAMTLAIYSKADGLPIFIEESRSHIFEAEEVSKAIGQLYKLIKSKLPYRGLVLSRRGQDVTINMGRSSGLKENDVVSISQIIYLQRHPKKQFIVGFEKETLGKVQLTKVEEHMSFGSIIFERETGVIKPRAKVIPETYVGYATPSTADKPSSDLEEKSVAFGKNPEEWIPEPPPQYGKIGLSLGLSQYSNSQTLTTVGSITAKNDFAPNLFLNGELWLSPEYYFNYNFRQGIFGVSNPYPGSSPSTIDMTLNQYSLKMGHNFLIGQDFLGSKIQISAGLQNTSLAAANSTPTAVTSMTYSGFLFSVGGQFSLFETLPLSLGANFDLFLSPSMAETPTSAGSQSTQINTFAFFVDYAWKTKTHIVGGLLFENYASSMGAGAGARSAVATNITNKITTLYFGVEYLF